MRTFEFFLISLHINLFVIRGVPYTLDLEKFRERLSSAPEKIRKVKTFTLRTLTRLRTKDYPHDVTKIVMPKV